MAKIRELMAREIFDSRGHPTVEVDCRTDSGHLGRAAVPSGASTGSHEALELRDADKTRFFGKGVLQAVRHVNEILAPRLKGMDVERQKFIDEVLIEMDGTPNKAKLGANAILGVSMAIAQAAAHAQGQWLFESLSFGKGVTLPLPFMNIINGGAHADNRIDFQEFMIVPGGFSSFREAIRAGVECFHSLRSLLKAKGHSTNVGDEGGLAPNFASPEETFDTILEAIRKAGYRPGDQISLALDVAASEFWRDERYVFRKSDHSVKTSDEMIDLYERLIDRYPLLSIEDGLGEEDWMGWKNLTARLGGRVQLVGDDLFVTNIEFLRRGMREKVANAVLIKLNQIGTITETVNAVLMAQQAGYGAVISHRSGETEDTTIADLAVALNTGMIKTGSASRTDRLAKYNQLLRIEEVLGSRAEFAGFSRIVKKT